MPPFFYAAACHAYADYDVGTAAVMRHCRHATLMPLRTRLIREDAGFAPLLFDATQAYAMRRMPSPQKVILFIYESRLFLLFTPPSFLSSSRYFCALLTLHLLSAKEVTLFSSP